jgi:hypothetical protein
LQLNGEIILFGGASMSLVFEARDSTKDIDALYEPKQIINPLIQKIASDHNLPENWLNDSVKGFVSQNSDIREFISFSNLKIHTVTPQYLLAMKLLATRGTGSTDYEDIKYLIAKLSLNSKEAVFQILAEFYPNNQVLPKTQYIIEELFMEDNPDV